MSLAVNARVNFEYGKGAARMSIYSPRSECFLRISEIPGIDFRSKKLRVKMSQFFLRPNLGGKDRSVNSSTPRFIAGIHDGHKGIKSVHYPGVDAWIPSIFGFYKRVVRCNCR